MKKELNDSPLLIDSLRNISVPGTYADLSFVIILHKFIPIYFKGVSGETVGFVNGHDGPPVFSVMKYVSSNTSNRFYWKNIATITG